MRRFLITALALTMLALPVAGCETTKSLSATWDSITSARVTPEAVGIAVRSFDAIEMTAKNYLLLDPAATSQIIASIKAGRVARNNLQQFLRKHPDGLGAQGAIDALTATTSTIQNVLTTYRAGT